MSISKTEIQLIFSRPRYMEPPLAFIRKTLQPPDRDVKARLANGWPEQ